jgi:hypothetical protein
MGARVFCFFFTEMIKKLRFLALGARESCFLDHYSLGLSLQVLAGSLLISASKKYFDEQRFCILTRCITVCTSIYPINGKSDIL